MDNQIINERIAGIERVLAYLQKQRMQLFDRRKIQKREYKLIIDEINDAKRRIHKLKTALKAD
ncbi:hypothetical protein [Wohlfahrtiimonas chitiniclastica]|uniref:hypothetical protein n=1 Tax=Wohlfahrtiimonas chitiniclastica TaxID=400946 RepID=UPI001BCB1376|nr:hypothetical protein [Wohlfahrtiimonas chitiniclastica]MBS7815874.1 hypothetical protein [Wohlfahrtiimonas chitiniclastica]MBS7822131.1 hypothetical protein [Wohlfahrtiimonas chitiniclastica]MBS7829923.1 hypothetical protein [Wohlfahrtiimonas chitiniclastica]MBS7831890.1 hypothetical protein [Wohlfahrtiimonas chitiniclastica]